MRKREIVADILIFLLIVLAVGGMIFASVEQEGLKSLNENGQRNALPILKISLSGTTLGEMKAGSKLIEYGGNKLLYQDNEEVLSFDNVEIRGRGNATWETWDKKPWRIKFDERVGFFGLTKTKKWILLTNAPDHSNMRNLLAFELAKMLDIDYASKGEMVEVEFDGEYEGLFYLVTKIDLGKGAVDLKNELGVLMELDDLRKDSEYYLSYAGNYLFMKDAVSEKDEELKKAAVQDFMVNFNEFEIALEEKDYRKIEEKIDIESFAKYFLVNEFSSDPDAYFIGFYMYKDGVDDKIHAGPVWDFDMAFANRSWGDYLQDEYFSPTETMVKRETNPSELFYDLMMLSEFRNEVKRIFQEKMAGKGEWFLKLGWKVANKIKDAVKRDAEKWEYDDYEEETEYVLNWVEKRYEYFEKVYGNL